MSEVFRIDSLKDVPDLLAQIRLFQMDLLTIVTHYLTYRRLVIIIIVTVGYHDDERVH